MVPPRLHLGVLMGAAAMLPLGCARTPLGAPEPGTGSPAFAVPGGSPDCRIVPLSPDFDPVGLYPADGGVVVIGNGCDEAGCGPVALFGRPSGSVSRVGLGSVSLRATARAPDGGVLAVLADGHVERLSVERADAVRWQVLTEGPDGQASAMAIAADARGGFVVAGGEPQRAGMSPAVWRFDAGESAWRTWRQDLGVDTRLWGVSVLAGGGVVAWGEAAAPAGDPEGPLGQTDPILVNVDRSLTRGRDAVGLGRFTGSMVLGDGLLLFGQTTDSPQGRAVTLPVDASGTVGAAVPLPEPGAGARAVYVTGVADAGGAVFAGGDFAEREHEVAVVVGVGGDGEVAWARRFPDLLRSVATFIARSPEGSDGADGSLAVLIESTPSCCGEVAGERAASLVWLDADGTCAE